MDDDQLLTTLNGIIRAIDDGIKALNPYYDNQCGDWLYGSAKLQVAKRIARLEIARINLRRQNDHNNSPATGESGD